LIDILTKLYMNC